MLSPPTTHPSDFELVEALTDHGYRMNRRAQEVETALNCARLIRLTCSEGMPSAVCNLYAIGNSHPDWWYEQGRVIQDAIAFATSEANSPRYALLVERDASRSPLDYADNEISVQSEDPESEIVDDEQKMLSRIPKTVWQETSWRLRCSFCSTQPAPTRGPGAGKKTFDSLFQRGWCRYLDKVCGGSFYMLEKERQKHRPPRTPSLREDIEQAFDIAFTECIAANSRPYSGNRQPTQNPAASDYTMVIYAELCEDMQKSQPGFFFRRRQLVQQLRQRLQSRGIGSKLPFYNMHETLSRLEAQERSQRGGLRAPEIDELLAELQSYQSHENLELLADSQSYESDQDSAYTELYQNAAALKLSNQSPPSLPSSSTSAIGLALLSAFRREKTTGYARSRRSQ